MSIAFGVLVPFVEHLGFTLERFEGGESELRYAARPEHLNSFQVTHGGALMTLLDVTMAVAARSVQQDMGVVTIEMKTSFMQPAIGPLARITEPQLPVYAAFGAAFWAAHGAEANEPIAGVHFGMVKIAEHTFEGVSEANFASEVDKRKPAFIQKFSDWQSLLNHWKSSIEGIAQEIKAGEAAVEFEDENLLNYCEVISLLRLPERQLQFERFQNPINESHAE